MNLNRKDFMRFFPIFSVNFWKLNFAVTQPGDDSPRELGYWVSGRARSQPGLELTRLN
jgi:hypothetical protein